MPFSLRKHTLTISFMMMYTLSQTQWLQTVTTAPLSPWPCLSVSFSPSKCQPFLSLSFSLSTCQLAALFYPLSSYWLFLYWEKPTVHARNETHNLSPCVRLFSGKVPVSSTRKSPPGTTDIQLTNKQAGKKKKTTRKEPSRLSDHKRFKYPQAKKASTPQVVSVLFPH